MNPEIISRFTLSTRLTNAGGDAVILFHTITEAICLVPEAQWQALRNPEGGIADPDMVRALRDGGILLGDATDECPAFRRWKAGHAYNRAELRFKNLITRQCNNRCPYCVLDAEAKTMAPETARDADRFVFQQIDEKRPDMVHDDFSGGEPMLNPAAIALSASRRQAYCREKGIDYGFSLTTNGTRLFPDIVESFVPLGLDGIRLSLAGPESVHNRLRPCADHDNPYELILLNLEKVAPLVPLSIECQYDAGSEDYLEIPSMLDELSCRGIPINDIAFTHIMETRRNTPFSAGGNIEIQLFLLDFAHERGFPVYDKPPRNGCMADYESVFVIDTDGSIIPCPSLQGGEMAYGNVATGVDFLAESALIERRLPRRCLTQCELLPLCGGGCRLQSLVKTGDFNAIDCHYASLRAMAEHWMEKRAKTVLACGKGM